MTDDERITLREHFDQHLDRIEKRLDQIEAHAEGVVTWRALAAITTLALSALAIILAATS